MVTFKEVNFEGGGRELSKPPVSTKYMVVISCVLLFLVIVGIVAGWHNCYQFTFSLELNTLNSPFYKVGVFSEYFDDPEYNQIEHQVTIGLFFIVITFVFFKQMEDNNSNII